MKKRDGFQKLSKFSVVKEEFLSFLDPLERSEFIDLEEACDRVLSSKLVSPAPVPGYDKSAMDGYAVRAKDTFGASDSSPIVLDLESKIQEGGAKRVHTGSVVPEEANAVVMIEDVEKNLDKLNVFKAMSPGENVDFVGDDIQKDEVVFEKGHLLRPFDIGFLQTLGIREVEVFEEPSILVVPTGNEVVSADEVPKPGEVIESNSIVIKLLVKKFGGTAVRHEIVKDDPKKIKGVLAKAVDFDLVVFTGGTSVGERDHTAEVVLEEGEVFFHGVAIKPGKPTFLGKFKKTGVICLPGNPVACTLTGILFLKPFLERMGHRSFFKKTTSGVLERKIESSVGYRTFTRVKIKDNRVIPVRTSGAGIQSSITSADGYVMIEEDQEGIAKGENVEVVLFE